VFHMSPQRAAGTAILVAADRDAMGF